MAGSNYKSFAQSLTILTVKEGETWSNATDSLGENPDKNVWAGAQSGKASFVTEHIAYKFKNSEIAEFLSANPTVAILKFNVVYSLVCTKDSGASISLQSYLASNGDDIGANSQIVDGIIEDESQGLIKTANVSFYLKEIPSNEALSSEKFQFVLSFNGNNPNNDTVKIRVYSIELQVINGTGVGYLLAVTPEGLVLENKGVASLDQILTSQLGSNKVYLYNVGDEKVTINQGNITTEKGYINFASQSWPIVVTEIPKSAFLEVSFTYSSKYVGYNTDSVIVNSNASNNPFTIGYEFSVISTGGQDLFPNIALSYQGSTIAEGSSFSLSSFPLGITTIVTIKVYNIGTSSLTVSSVSVSGDGSLSSGSIGPGTVIPSLYYGNINVNLSTNIEGTKSISVQVVSNSIANSVYDFTLTYAVLQQSKIEFREGFSSGSSNSVLVDGQETDFGTVERDRSLSRYFVLKNSGIYKTLIINSVTSSSPNMPLSGLPSFPYTLIPNNGNAITFSVSFETSEVGLKEGVLSIDYVEGSIYQAPTTSSPVSPPSSPVSPPSSPVNPPDVVPIPPGGKV